MLSASLPERARGRVFHYGFNVRTGNNAWDACGNKSLKGKTHK